MHPTLAKIMKYCSTPPKGDPSQALIKKSFVHCYSVWENVGIKDECRVDIVIDEGI